MQVREGIWTETLNSVSYMKINFTPSSLTVPKFDLKLFLLLYFLEEKIKKVFILKKENNLN